MSVSNRKDLAKTILSVARFFGKDLTQDALSMVLDVWEMQISNGVTTFEEVVKTYNDSITRFRAYPAPVQILDLIRPQMSQEDEATALAGRVINAVKNYGYMGGGGAKAELGPVAWEAIRRFGGWSYLCENLGTHSLPVGIFQAQLKQSLQATSKEMALNDRMESAACLTGGQDMLKLLNIKAKELP